MNNGFTVLQRGDGLALLAVFTVSDVIGGLHLELVGSERLQPIGKNTKYTAFTLRLESASQ